MDIHQKSRGKSHKTSTESLDENISGHDKPENVKGSGISFTTLLRQLTYDVTGLVGKEFALAKAEIHESSSHVKKGILSLLIGLAVLICGLTVTLIAGAQGLALILPVWAATLIVGGATLLLGIILLLIAAKKFSADKLKPSRSIDAYNKDKQTIQGGFNEQTK